MSGNFISLVLEASILSQLVLLFLLAMSISSWTIIFMKRSALKIASQRITEGSNTFENTKALRDAIHAIGTDSTSPLYAVAQSGVDEFNRSREANIASELVVENIERSLAQGVAMEMTRVNKNMSILATCSNTAPFIGLFGTVWGIMSSFQSIGIAKSASLATVAPGISEALIATAVGLFVAIPASMAYNSFSTMIEDIETQLCGFSTVFINSVQRELGK